MSLGSVHSRVTLPYNLSEVVTRNPRNRSNCRAARWRCDFANTVDWTEDERGDRRDRRAARGRLARTAGAGGWSVAGRPGGRGGARARARPARRAAPHLLGARARAGAGPVLAVAPALRLRAGGRRRHARCRATTAASASTGATTSRGACASPSPPTRSRCSPTPTALARAAPLPRPRLRLGLPRHQRPPPLVLDGDLRQPREDAPDVRAQARLARADHASWSGCVDSMTGPSGPTRTSSSSRIPPRSES